MAWHFLTCAKELSSVQNGPSLGGAASELLVVLVLLIDSRHEMDSESFDEVFPGIACQRSSCLGETGGGADSKGRKRGLWLWLGWEWRNGHLEPRRHRPSEKKWHPSRYIPVLLLLLMMMMMMMMLQRLLKMMVIAALPLLPTTFLSCTWLLATLLSLLTLLLLGSSTTLARALCPARFAPTFALGAFGLGHVLMLA